MKKNAELKIEYLSQENDRDLLLKQLIFQKKESQRLRSQADILKQKALEAGVPRVVIDKGPHPTDQDLFGFENVDINNVQQQRSSMKK
jgi:hypothetical protein